MTTTDSGLSATLADYAARLQFTDLPAEVAHEAKRALVDHVGVAVAAAGHPAVDALLRTSNRLVGTGEYTVIGRSEKASMPYAALTNGFAAHLLDYDDTFNPGDTTVHGSAPVWPVIFALAEDRPISGADALAAFVAGFETECRLGRAAGDAHYEIGWHVTGTVGHLGAAAAAGRVLHLSPAVLNQALGSAGTQAAGLKAVYGTDGKALHAGKAAMDGLLSAVMAEEGITSSTVIMEGERGFLAVLSTDPAPAKLVEKLGEQWHLLANGYKAYPSGSLTHPAIDAVLALRSAHGFAANVVKRVVAKVNSKAATVTGKVDPQTGLDAKFSLTHGVAVALRSRPRLDDFTDAAAADPEIATLRDLVDVRSDSSIGKRAASVTVELADGTVLVGVVEANKGTPDNPMTDDDLSEKFTDNVAPRLGAGPAAALLAALW
ncbi:MAG: MmgE/PrpD family protein, partial [Mycobacterium sp.]